MLRKCVQLILVVMLGFANIAQGCELKVRVFSYPPLAVKNSQGDWSGLDIDHINALFSTAGCRPIFIDVPFARGIKMLKRGQLDLMVDLSKTKERIEHIEFIGPYRNETMRFISRKGALPLLTNWQQFESLEATLLRQRGTYLGARFNKVLQKNQVLKDRLVILADNGVRMVMIKKGRADGFFATASFLNEQIKTNPAYADLIVHPLIIYSHPVFFGFSKKNVPAARLLKLKKAFELLAKTSRLQDIENKYIEY